MLFKKEFLIDRLGDRETTIADEIIDQRRWVTVHRQVFSHDGKFYETVYEHGSTECQDQAPYEYAEDDIECPEVVAVQKTFTVYEKASV